MKKDNFFISLYIFNQILEFENIDKSYFKTSNLFRLISISLKSKKRIILKHVNLFFKILNRLRLKRSLRKKVFIKRKHNEMKRLISALSSLRK